MKLKTRVHRVRIRAIYELNAGIVPKNCLERRQSLRSVSGRQLFRSGLIEGLPVAREQSAVMRGDRLPGFPLEYVGPGNVRR